MATAEHLPANDPRPSTVADSFLHGSSHRAIFTPLVSASRVAMAGGGCLVAEVLVFVGKHWISRPWVQVATLYAIVMLFFLIAKLSALSSILAIVTMKSQQTLGLKISGILWGMVEDVGTTTLLFAFVLVIDFVLLSLGTSMTSRVGESRSWRLCRYIGHGLRWILVFTVVILMLTPFAADVVLLQTRQMRFTFEFVTMYFRDKADASSLEVDPSELRTALQVIAAAVLTGVVFGTIYVGTTDFYDLMVAGKGSITLMTMNVTPKLTEITSIEGLMAPSQLEESCHEMKVSVDVEPERMPSSQDETESESFLSIKGESDWTEEISTVGHHHCTNDGIHNSRWIRITLACVLVIMLLVATLIVSRSITPAMAAIALNTTLNELFWTIFRTDFLPPVRVAKLSARDIVHSDTEAYTLFRDDVIYRRTTGFKGPLAFDVEVDQENLPNVLVLAVESFRYHDSLYLASNTSAGEVLKKHNITLTPNFDRWAKRGVAFSNMWSSWQTSRSVESILFGQIPLDSKTQTGTTTGRTDMKLAGMPQFFKLKGYEAIFSTGCKLTYDGWNSFFKTHGFDSVLGLPEYRRIAEEELGIHRRDWKAQNLSFHWGVHDDTTFEVLGRILRNKTHAQQQSVAEGRSKQPFFVTHYTISSHTPYIERPNWYAHNLSSLPDFSPLYEGKKNEAKIKHYAEMRYFQDLTMGKFLDTMEKAGILNDTVLVIVGDHGQSPEDGLAKPYLNQVATTHVAGALIAEGRLSRSAIGQIMDDAVEHYDLLNTLADIVGAPNEGFLQSSVGRSLKRAIKAGTRPVWSNNPLKTLSVILGHKRLEYDPVSSRLLLHDAAEDPLGLTDLFNTLSRYEKSRWLHLRDIGRELDAYFKKRWLHKCITAVEC